MVIENKLNSAKIRLAYIITIFLSLVFIIWALFKDIPNHNYKTLYLAVSFFCGYIYFRIINAHYFYFTDWGTKISIKFFNIHPFIQKYKSYEIPKSSIKKYSISSAFFGLKKFLIIEVKVKNKEITYPRVNISGLTSIELSKLKKTLDKLVK